MTYPSKNLADNALLIAKGRYNNACSNKIEISDKISEILVFHLETLILILDLKY